MSIFNRRRDPPEEPKGAILRMFDTTYVEITGLTQTQVGERVSAALRHGSLLTFETTKGKRILSPYAVVSIDRS